MNLKSIMIMKTTDFFLQKLMTEIYEKNVMNDLNMYDQIWQNMTK